METLYYSRMKSPIGPLWIAVSDIGVVAIEFGAREFPPAGKSRSIQWVESPEKTETVRRQLQEYFDGERTEFTVAIDLQTGTQFQRHCWKLLMKIPYGEIRSYQEMAKAVGRPKAARAVGQANGANPIPIIIPCHRVINADGHLGGYGGGLDIKEELLALEQALPASTPLLQGLEHRRAVKAAG